MDLVNLAVAVVFVSNAIILILLVYMLIRILGQTEQTREMMVGAARELNDSARVVRDAAYKLGDGKSAGGVGGTGVTALPVPGLDALDKLNHMVEEMSHRDSGFDSQKALADIKRLMESMASTDPAQMVEWQNKHKTELEQALAQRNRLAAETEQMRQRLHEAHRIILELRRANRAAEASGQTVEALRTEVQKQQQIIDRARERLRVAETKAEGLKADVERLSMLNPAGAADNTALKEARRKLAQVESERDAQARELDALKDSMERTLVEKNFIEERFLRLDSERQDAAGSTARTGQNAALEPA
jgi:chromosome segregation ATPase